METKLKELKTYLSEKGVDLTQMMFVSSGSEQILGIYGGESAGKLTILNPLRLFRIQRLGQGGTMDINFMVGDYDMMTEDAHVTIVPQVFFRLDAQPVETQLGYGALIANFIDNKAKSRAAEAGIVMPQLVRPPR